MKTYAKLLLLSSLLTGVVAGSIPAGAAASYANPASEDVGHKIVSGAASLIGSFLNLPTANNVSPTPSPVPNPLSAAASPISGATATPAPAPSSVRFFPHGEDSLAARLAAIKSATQTIDILTYIFQPCDSSTKLLLDALVERSQSGVAVRLTLDQLDISADSSKLQGLTAYIAKINTLLAHPIEFRLYSHPAYGLPFNPEAADNRSHIKILLIDAAGPNPVAFVGGRNNSDGYFGLSADMNYFDQDLMISGAETAHKVLVNYNGILKYASFSYPLNSVQGTSENFEAKCLAKSPRDQAVSDAISTKSLTILDPATTPSYQCSEIYFDMDDPRYRLSSLGNGVGDDDLNDARLIYKTSSALVLSFIEDTSNTLFAVNQYYIPVGKLKGALGAVRDAGKMVTIVTNSTGDAGPQLAARMTGLVTDAMKRDTVGTMMVYGLSSLGGLHDDGALRISTAPWRIHTKTAVRDHNDVLVSSFNFDSRSYQINAEDAVMVANCPALAQAMEVEYQKLIQVYVQDQSCQACQDESSTNLRALPLSPPAGMNPIDFLF